MFELFFLKSLKTRMFSYFLGIYVKIYQTRQKINLALGYTPFLFKYCVLKHIISETLFERNLI